MTVPCELDPVVLQLELDQAWQMAQEQASAAEMNANLVRSQRRALHRQHPRVEGFGRIAALVWEWQKTAGRRPAEHFLQSIQSEIERANKAAETVVRAQGES